MQRRIVSQAQSLRGEIVVPADKSISHRAVMLGAIASGTSMVRNFLRAEDPLSTINVMRHLGVAMNKGSEGEVIIEGRGLPGLREARTVLDCGNSGTTIRLLSGLLAGRPFLSVLTGDDSIRQRPMARIVRPLRQMGAAIFAREEERFAPLAIRGGELRPSTFVLPSASAQVKSCLLLAGLSIEGTTQITEPEKTRDHTERMLQSLGAQLHTSDLTVSVCGGKELAPFDLTVPSDFSSAAFFIAAALIVPNSELIIRSVGVNPTRTGFLQLLKEMGAPVRLENIRETSGEPVADIICTTAPGLHSIEIGKREVALSIDEFPILCILATQAEGTTIIRGAQELRVKESDRIRAMADGLTQLGVKVEELEDGIAITGKSPLSGGEIESHRDHRIAMAFAIGALIARKPVTIREAASVDISFPGFFEHLDRLTSTN